MTKFDKNEGEHEIKLKELEAHLSYPFALKMASLIGSIVLFSIVLLGIFFGDKTPLVFVITLIVGLVFAIISFKTTYSSIM